MNSRYVCDFSPLSSSELLILLERDDSDFLTYFNYSFTSSLSEGLLTIALESLSYNSLSLRAKDRME